MNCRLLKISLSLPIFYSECMVWRDTMKIYESLYGKITILRRLTCSADLSNFLTPPPQYCFFFNGPPYVFGKTSLTHPSRNSHSTFMLVIHLKEYVTSTFSLIYSSKKKKHVGPPLSSCKNGFDPPLRTVFKTLTHPPNQLAHPLLNKERSLTSPIFSQS